MSAATKQQKFVMCVNNDECEDLETRKVYRVLPDKRAEVEGNSLVVDESGEDDLYPQSCFVFVRLPQEAQRAVAAPECHC